MTLRVAVEPTGVRGHLAQAVKAGDGQVVGPEDAEALVWADPAAPGALSALLTEHPAIRWVQLPWAGIEPYVDVVRAHADRTWTCGKGVYAEPVAEMALALALAGRRGLGHYARAGRWTGQRGEMVLGSRITILGGGGITGSLLRLLGPFGGDVTVVRATPQPMDGVARVLAADRVDEALAGADLVLLALALTPETEGIVDARRLALVAEGAGLVNVARGRHVVTDALIPALDDGPLGSVGLDVTDPEPLPGGHPLWGRPEVIITPHTANTEAMAVPLLGARVTENVRRYQAGDPLVGPVDPALGY
jgi:phosphoglycerate dehydrogenase-like enzyme